jgi:hypothetical protein
MIHRQGGVMRAFMLFISLILVVVALMLLGADLVTSLEMRGTIVVRSIATVWDLLDKGGPDALRQWSTNTLPAFATTAINWVLGIYSWLVPGVLGVTLAFVFGRKQADV